MNRHLKSVIQLTKLLSFFTSLAFFLGAPFLCQAAAQPEEFQIPVPPFIARPWHQLTPDQYGKAVKDTVLVQMAPTLRLNLKELHEATDLSHGPMGVDFTKSSLPKESQGMLCDFSDLKKVKWSNSVMKLNRFIGSNLENANLMKSQIEGADFYGASLKSINFSDSHVFCSRFENADLSQASFKNATIKGSSLLNCTIEGVDFTGCTFVDCQISQTIYELLKKSDKVSLTHCLIVPPSPAP